MFQLIIHTAVLFLCLSVWLKIFNFLNHLACKLEVDPGALRLAATLHFLCVYIAVFLRPVVCEAPFCFLLSAMVARVDPKKTLLLKSQLQSFGVDSTHQ